MTRPDGIRLAESRRARIPFAVLGVLLLAGTVVVSVTVHDRERVGATADGRASVERAVAAGDTAFRAAVRDASAAAAANPVTAPAATPTGSVIDDETAFRDALRIRIYVAARERLGSVEERVGETRTTLSLPATPTAEALADAKRRVDLERIEGGLEATVEGVRVRTFRGGRRVAEETRSFSVGVETPALALHDSVGEFETRLDRGPTAGPGLGQRLTGWLYALGWGRGYAQYGGAPISNVLGTRHLALATNSGVLAVQRSVFGAADADGLAAQRRATVRVGTQDLLAASDGPTDWADQIFRGDPDAEGEAASLTAPDTDAPGPDDRMEVEIGATADRAFTDVLAEYESVLEAGYETRARLSTEVELVDRGDRSIPHPPGGGWERVDSAHETDVRIVDGDGPPASIPHDHRRYSSSVRQVRTTHRLETTWERGNETRRLGAEWTVVRRVSLSVSGRPDPGDDLPDAPTRPLYETGGPLDGPNLRDVPDRAVERLIDDRGGVDAIARRTVENGPDSVVITLRGDRPEGLVDWAYADLIRLRERVRDVNASVRRGTIGTGANPPEALAAALRERRSDLLDVPETYDGVADRARVAVRAAYLDAVLARLDEDAQRSERTRSRLRDLLAERDFVPDGGIEGLLDARGGDSPDPRPTLSTFSGRTSLRIDGEPPYLTAVAVEGRRAPGVGGEYHALAARNRNLFAHPYGDAASEIVGAFVDDTDRVSLDPAARTLRAANRTNRAATDEELRERRGELVATVGERMGVVVDRTAGRIAAKTSLDEPTARRAVEEGLREYPTLDVRALAVTNGSAARPIGDAVLDRIDAVSLRERDRYRLVVRESLRAATDASAARPSGSPVERTGDAAQRVARSRIEDAVEDGIRNFTEGYREELFGEGPAAVPSGLPVTPIPWLWYGTLNVWEVSVRGEYARFSVSAPVGGADRPGGEVTYSRDGGAVHLDVDEDGVGELLGRSERVGFEVETVVAVAVPPGGTGVGDTTAVEESAGWPCPGPASGECDRDNSSSDRREDMFHEQRRDVDGLDPAGLRAEYDAELSAVVESVGVDAAAEASGVDRASIEALVAGERPDLSLEEAAGIAALAEGEPDPETVVEIASEHLLLGMSTGVMDVDTLAAAVALDLDPKEIQQKLERRAPMSFDEFVHLQHAIADRQP